MRVDWRFANGELLPKTLGALRAQYGFALVDENTGGDDIDGPHARLCRLPYLLFALGVNDTARHVPDSARVTRVDMDTPGADTVIARFCLAHQPSNDVEAGRGLWAALSGLAKAF